MRNILSIFILLVLASLAEAQISLFPYRENFDSVAPPALPNGWTSTQNRTPGTNDFTTAAGSARSTPNAVLSTNARISQTLFSPFLNFTTRIVDSVIFYERRSPTYTTGILVEASIDSGITFPIAISDTLQLLNPTTYIRRAFALPKILSGRNNVKIRWRVLGDLGGGTTATLRFDDILITVKTQFDAGISTIRFSPPFPVAGDSVLVNAAVRNYGIQPIQDFLVSFYDDLNRDSIPQPVELFDSIRIVSSISSGDSSIVPAVLYNLPLGDKRIIVETMLLNDENPANDRKFERVSIGVRQFTVVINEIMYGPTSPEPEWVEIVNTSSDTIPLRQWKIADRNTATRATITTTDFYLPPGGFAVVAKDSTLLFAVHPNIPSRVFHVPTLSILNNDSDAVVIFDHRGVIIDSVHYRSSWGGTSGRSLERIDARGPSNLQTNWGSSTHPARSTPGSKNSLTPKDFDVAVTRIIFSPPAPVVGDSVFVHSAVKNLGRFSAQNILVEFFEDANGDSLPQPEELSAAHTVSQLASGDSIILSAQRMSLQFGDHLFIVRAEFTGDEDTTNNTRRASISAGYPPGTLVINEIMYGPTSPEPEWIEITNTTTDSINLRQWKVSDRNTATRTTITTADFFLLPGGFAVIAKDSAALVGVHPNIPSRVFHVPTLPILNNDSDAVVLFDHRGAVGDSVNYKSRWGGTSGRSLERVETSGPSLLQGNWGSSTHPARSTPGSKNSLTPKDIDVAVTRILFTPIAPVVGDSVFVFATVKNPGRFSAQGILVEFFEDANGDSLPQLQERFAVELIAEIASGDSVVLSAQQSSLAVGDHLFIVRAELPMDEDTTNNIKRSVVTAGYPAGTVVINEVMYAPTGGEPEWVEFLNAGADSVSLRNWRVSNRNSSTRYTITASDIVFRRDEYIVVTKDTALFYTRHPNVRSAVIQTSTLPTFLFNNNGDAVVLFDSRGAKMDSVQYAPTWGGANGKSLERIDRLFTSNDSTNWGSSVDSGGSTPGRHNSLTPVEFDLRATRIGSEVSFPSLNIRVVVTNVGHEPVSDFAVALFHDTNADSAAQQGELLERRMISSVLPARDSLSVDFQWAEPGFGRKQLIAMIEYPQDLRPSNNTAFGLARVNYPEGSLVINEIMYGPLTGQAEYVELYNRSQLGVDLRDWKISDMRNTSGVANEFTISRRQYIAQPGSYVVVSSDSSLLVRFNLAADSASGIHLFILNRGSLSLNNEGDDVVLSDLTGSIIDSVRYAPTWHNAQVADVTGRALERINPELPTGDRRNWSTCAHYLGGTPGKRNSIFTASVPSSVSLAFSPNPFSPDGDGFEDFTLISYEVPSTGALLRIRIFDARGRLVRTLVSGEPTGARGSVVWDGMNDGRNKVRMGIYVVLLEALDVGGSTIHSTKGAVVVAVRL